MVIAGDLMGILINSDHPELQEFGTKALKVLRALRKVDQWWGYVFIKAEEIEECTDIDTFINTARKELPDVFDQMMKFHIVEAHMRVVNFKNQGIVSALLRAGLYPQGNGGPLHKTISCFYSDF